MLPASHRLRRSTEFSQVVRTGVRARRGVLVVHHLDQAGVVDAACPPARVGLIVGRTVGGSVVRHRVSRRLRAQLASRLDRLPCGSSTVVRALPDAASATSARLAADLDGALAKLAGGRRSVR